MIFGFNTDIEVEGTVYHVQTEVREQSALLETQIFVKGRCVGRRGSHAPANFSDEQVQELARSQHRQVVEAIRGGRMLGLALTKEAAQKEGTAAKGADATLTVEFLASQRISAAELLLRFRVQRGAAGAAGAELSAIWKDLSPTGGDALPADGQSGRIAASAGEDGIAELRIALGESSAELEVSARFEGNETARRFLLKPSRG